MLCYSEAWNEGARDRKGVPYVTLRRLLSGTQEMRRIKFRSTFCLASLTVEIVSHTTSSVKSLDSELKGGANVSCVLICKCYSLTYQSN